MTTGPARRRAPSLAAGLAVATVVLTGCGLTQASGPPQIEGGPLRMLSVDGHQIAVPAPGKPTAVFFFSVTCGECAAGAQSLGEAARMASTAHANAAFIAVDVDPGDTRQNIASFMDAVHAVGFPVAIDTNAVAIQRFGVSALSILIVVDVGGRVTYRATDPNANEIIAALKKAGT